MKAENYESRLVSSMGGDIVLSTDGSILRLGVEGDDGRALFAFLVPENARELKAMITMWENLYYDGELE